MSRTSHNLVYLFISQLATWSITLIVLVVAPRYLGPEAFGELGFALAFIQFFVLGASLGTRLYLTRRVARDSAIIGTYVYNAVVMKLVAGTLLSIFAVLVARRIGTTGDKFVLVVFGCVGMMLGILNDVFVGALAGLERMGRTALWNTMQVYAASISGVLILFAGGGVLAYGFAFAFAGVVPLIANSRVVWPWTKGCRHIDFGVWARLARGGFPLMLLGALTVFYGTVDIPILSYISDDTTVGWYMLAWRFVGIPVFIASITMTAFFPSFSAHGGVGSAEFAGLVNGALRLVAQVAVPASAGIAVLAGPLINVLYDARFDGTVPIMQILALQIPAATMGVVLGTALVASDRQNPYLAIAAVAAVLNPALCFAVIPWAMDRFDNGGIGAALVTVGTELFIFAGALALRATGVMDKATTLFCLRVVAASSVMAAVLAVLPELPLPLLVVIGIGIYAASAMALRTIVPNDLRSVKGVLMGAVRTARASRQRQPEVDEVPSTVRQDVGTTVPTTARQSSPLAATCVEQPYDAGGGRQGTVDRSKSAVR